MSYPYFYYLLSVTDAFIEVITNKRFGCDTYTAQSIPKETIIYPINTKTQS